MPRIFLICNIAIYLVRVVEGRRNLIYLNMVRNLPDYAVLLLCRLSVSVRLKSVSCYYDYYYYCYKVRKGIILDYICPNSCQLNRYLVNEWQKHMLPGMNEWVNEWISQWRLNWTANANRLCYFDLLVLFFLLKPSIFFQGSDFKHFYRSGRPEILCLCA